MSVILECPVCESRFQLELVPPRVECPACKTSFKTPIASSSPSSTDPGRPSTLAQAPRRLQSTQSATPPPGLGATQPTAASADVRPTSKPNATVHQDFAVDAGPGSASVFRARPKKNIWVSLTSLLLAVLAIGGLFAIVTILGEPGETSAGSKDTETEPAEAASNESAIDDALADDQAPAPEKKALPPIDETPEYFRMAQMEQVWNQINGYLVRLEVKTPARIRTISGLIVDSRGWVVTSLSALEDAGEVNVTLAGKNLSDQPPYRELQDLSRGIIAEDPDSDLALISINRAQVINLADIPLLEVDNVVEASRLLIARTPPPRHHRWLAEGRIATRGSQDSLPQSVQRKLQTHKLDPGGSIKWFVYPPRLPSNLGSELAGSPLVDESGTVVGINTGIVADGNALAVPATSVRRLIDSVDGSNAEPRPFARAADLIRRTTEPAADPVIEEKQNSFEDTISSLLDDIDACRKTDWSAELESEYASMQSLSKHLDHAFDWVANNLTLVEDPERYDELLDTALEEITMSLEDDLIRDEFYSGKGNEFFFRLVNQENPWFIVSAEVVTDQFNSPQIGQRETVVFEVTGTGKHIMAVAGPEARNFRKGRRFLLIGKLDPMGTVRSGMFEGEQTVKLVNIHSNIEIALRRGGEAPPGKQP